MVDLKASPSMLTEDAEEELEAIMAIYAQDLCFVRRDAHLPDFAACAQFTGGVQEASQCRRYARVIVFRFDSAVTRGCDVHHGVLVVVGVPAHYPVQSGLDVAISLEAKESAGLSAVGTDGQSARSDGQAGVLESCDETSSQCGVGASHSTSCQCRGRLLKLAPRLQAHVLQKKCAFFLDR